MRVATPRRGAGWQTIFCSLTRNGLRLGASHSPISSSLPVMPSTRKTLHEARASLELAAGVCFAEPMGFDAITERRRLVAESAGGDRSALVVSVWRDGAYGLAPSSGSQM
jgi:hypothetical protein